MPESDPSETVSPTECPIERNRVLAPLTTWKVGGPALYFAEPANPSELAFCYQFAVDASLAILPLGGASNMLISDQGFPGLVIRYADKSEHEVETETELRLRAGGRTLFARMARKISLRGWSGLEWAEGIPGTVGGAVAGNAGAYGGDTASVVDDVEVFVPEERIVRRLRREECGFGYRTSRFKEEGPLRGFVLGAAFRLKRDDPDAVRKRLDGIRDRRKASSPSGLSCGSVFKNPEGDFAGRVIEALGLKGHTVGGAKISEVHGNYIVNLGGARSVDVLALIQLMQDEARSRLGIELEPEVRIVGGS